MIKLSKVYSNKPNHFKDINFRTGLNVVFASVSSDLGKGASHSLGKTILIDLIDFCFLKKISSDHFLKNRVFNDFDFYLEIQYADDKFVTIKRPVVGKVAIKKTDSKWHFFLSDSDDVKWDYDGLSLERAKTILNELICPRKIMVDGFNYRNGLRYCFRRQTEYENTFKKNNSREGDSSWTPYLASILGIDYKLVQSKYDANNKVKAIESAIKEVSNIESDSGQGLEAEITQIEAAVTRMKSELDGFDFRKVDDTVSKELIDEVSNDVSSMISRVYSLDQRLSAIDKSLQAEFSFEMDKVISLFEEVSIYFPDALVKSYDELIDVNKEMSIGRRERLLKTKRSILSERHDLNSKLDVAREKQRALTLLLLQKDAFEKYKGMQDRLIAEESRVAVLRERLAKLDLAVELKEQLHKAEEKRVSIAKKLELATRVMGNITLTKAVTIFSELIEHILNFSAFFYIETNREGNIQFKIGLREQTTINRGFSYTRVISAVFDVTLLALHSHDDFYRFCYHDGVLESLDDRLKLKLIDEWRKISIDNDLQLIITVLDSDLPLIEEQKEYFKHEEVIRLLHDRGDSGRLFTMPAF
ncbi:MAG: DUF2326 domain-containing protein [Plesiomonas shigelloides]